MNADAVLLTLPDTFSYPAGRSKNTRFLALLGLIAISSALIRLYVSANGLMDFDEWQHVFMASGARWSDVAFELNTNAHPPLFFLLLRSLLHAGHSKLLYRTLSIFSGASSVLLIGFIARKVCQSGTVALLCASAFACSATAISISSQVRSYQLTIFFVLLGFLFYLEMLSDDSDKLTWRPYLLFALATTGAVACHYFAGLFLVACVAVPVLLALGGALYRSDSAPIKSTRAFLRSSVAAAVPLSVLAGLYLSHARRQPLQGYLYPFYFGFGPIPHETGLAFTIRNLQNLANLFSPFAFESRLAFLSTVALVCVAALCILIKTWTRESSSASRRTDLPILFALVLLGELIALSINCLYPFGGMMRHQYIIAPFIVIAGFLLLDRLISLLNPLLRASVLTLVVVSIALNAAVSWPTLIVGRGQVAYQKEFQHYRAAFPAARAVYLDHFGIIGYFIHTDDKQRQFVRHISDTAFIDQYWIEGGSSAGTQIFYDKSRINLDLADPGIYKSFASCLRQSGTKELTLFLFTAGNVPLGQQSDNLKRIVAMNAAHESLAVTNLVINGNAVFAGFALKTGGTNEAIRPMQTSPAPR